MTNSSLVNLVALINCGYAIWIGVIGPISVIYNHIQLGLLLGYSERSNLFLIFSCLFLFFVGIVLAVSAMFIQRRKHRIFSVVVGVCFLFLFPMGTLIGGFTLYSLFRQQTIQEYRVR